MSLAELYFKTEGRINRKKYLMGALPLMGLYIVALILDEISGSRVVATYGIFQLIAIVINLWPAIALGVKRLHDRNRNGWLVLLSYVPVVNIWICIEILFLKGTVGVNKYGQDPLSIVVATNKTN